MGGAKRALAYINAAAVTRQYVDASTSGDQEYLCRIYFVVRLFVPNLVHSVFFYLVAPSKSFKNLHVLRALLSVTSHPVKVSGNNGTMSSTEES
jgi:hypothetical protein